MNIKEMIQALREKFTEHELAARLGCDRSTVNRWLNGRNVPTGDSALKVVKLHQESGGRDG